MNNTKELQAIFQEDANMDVLMNTGFTSTISLEKKDTIIRYMYVQCLDMSFVVCLITCFEMLHPCPLSAVCTLVNSHDSLTPLKYCTFFRDSSISSIEHIFSVFSSNQLKHAVSWENGKLQKWKLLTVVQSVFYSPKLLLLFL